MRAALGFAVLGVVALFTTGVFSLRGHASTAVRNGEIAFTRYRLQNDPLWSEIWVSLPDGSGAHKISHSPKAVEDDQAHFSPDGRKIVFDRCTRTGPCSVWLVRPYGSGQVRVKVPCPVTECDDSNATFAPDGQHLVVQHEWGAVKHGTIGGNDQIEHSALVEVSLDGTALHVLRQLDGWRGGFEAPRVTPDGKSLVFRAYTWAPDHLPAFALFVAPVSGGPARRITPFRLSAGGAEVAPDGKHVLFRSTDASGELTPGNALYTVGLDGRGLHRITKPSASSYVLTGSYSPDGRSLVFATNAGATGSFADVFTLDLATGRRVQVTHTPNLDGWPTWGRAAN
jgi:Tol biopolymer transport system component